MNYIRHDIYICPDCGFFFDDRTNKLVDVPYSDMPAEFALEVMQIRQRKSKCGHKSKVRKAKPRGKGFTEQE